MLVAPAAAGTATPARRRSTDSRDPWSPTTVRIVGAVAAGGSATIGVAWFGAAGTVVVGGQVTWAVLGLAGTCATLLAMTGWVLAGRSAVVARIDSLAAGFGAGRWAANAPRRVGSDARLVAAATMARYHRESCPLAAGKRCQVAERAGHEAAGRRPCGVCLRATPPPPSRGTPPDARAEGRP